MEVRGSLTQVAPGAHRPPGLFATPEDHAECKRLHRLYGTTYYFATCRFEARIRRRVHALYGFVRVPDEWVDNSGDPTYARERLGAYRAELVRGLDGVCPSHPALRAFCDVVNETAIPIDEPLRFLDAMERDLSVTRYATYTDLREYMRGSASSVGLMMCSVMEAGSDPEMLRAAEALGEAMQLTNFLRDLGEDFSRGRIYLPSEDLVRFGVGESDIANGRVTGPFQELMRFEIERARQLYAAADTGIPILPSFARRPVRLARVLYSRILDRIESNGYDVFTRRARTSTLEKLWVGVTQRP